MSTNCHGSEPYTSSLLNKRKGPYVAYDTPDPKRQPFTTDSESESESDSDVEDDFEYTPKKPHEVQNQSILEYIFNVKQFMSVVVDKVMENTRLNPLIDGLMLSLLNSGGGDDEDFSGKVNELFNCPDFIQACIDTYFKAEDGCCFFTLFLETYKDETQPHERMKNLRDDPFFLPFLEEIKLAPTRGVLSALFGFWSDDAFYYKLASEVRRQHMAIYGNS